MRRLELIIGLAWLALGVVVTVASAHLRIGSVARPGPGLMPFLLGILLTIAAIVFVFKTAVSTVEDSLDWELSDLPRPAVLIGLIGLFALAMRPVGFLPTAFLFLLVISKTVDRRPLLFALSFAAIGAAATYLLFRYFLRVDLPPGLMPKGLV